MTAKTIGFIGGGRVTRILLEGWRRANALPANMEAQVSELYRTRLPALYQKIKSHSTTDSHPLL